MKKVLFLSVCCAVSMLTACFKEPVVLVDEPTVINPTDSVLAQANFVNGAHATSGMVKLVKDKDDNKVLIFENFKTDAGPDLRIYLATNTQATNFTELTDDVRAGNYQVPIPSTVNTTDQKFVLIWCKQFSVLFGNAELK